MKTKFQRLFPTIALWVVTTCNLNPSTAHAQGTAFTYEGQLNSGGNPVTGLFDFQFSLYDAAAGGNQIGNTVTLSPLGVTNGLFSATLQFGAVFTGNRTWVAVSVRASGVGSYSALSPLQELTPTPYAIYAETAANSAYALTANSVNNNTAVSLYANGTRAMLLQPDILGDGAPSIIGGSPANSIPGNVVGATIGGGGATAYQGAINLANVVTADFGTISGGLSNNVSGKFATVAGGATNIASSDYSFAAGQQAQATNQGAFVWADASSGAFSSTNDNSFNVRAQGGVTFLTSGSGLTVDGQLIYPMGNPGSGLYVQQNNDGAPNVIAGSLANSFNSFGGAAIEGATISGGGTTNGPYFGYFSDYVGNSVNGIFGTVGGGLNNIAGSSGTVGSSGNFGTVSGGQDNIASGDFSSIGGGKGNRTTDVTATVGGGVQNTAGLSSVVAGGYLNNADAVSVIGGGQNNTANGSGTVGGGFFNRATNTLGGYATVGGGEYNTASGGLYGAATVGGGNRNLATNDFATVGGGARNTAGGAHATIGGGFINVASADNSTVGGGAYNQATNLCATVPGGSNNVAGGQYSFAAGQQAQATNDGAFVWSDDSSTAPFTSTNNNSFNVRTIGGVRFVTGIDGSGNPKGGVMVAAGDTSWTTVCDRNAKKNFTPVNGQVILAKLAAIPIEQWNYQWQKDSDVPNIGPMAQDFKAAFYPGRDDKSITTLEFDGVELAAIQGLNQKLEDRSKELEVRSRKLEAENTELKQLNDKLSERLNQLAASVQALAERK